MRWAGSWVIWRSHKNLAEPDLLGWKNGNKVLGRIDLCTAIDGCGVWPLLATRGRSLASNQTARPGGGTGSGRLVISLNFLRFLNEWTDELTSALGNVAS